MAVSIEDIWDEPVEESIGPRSTTSKKAEDPLFLAGSDDDEVPNKKGEAPDMDVDIDAMFAGVEDDDAFSFKPLADIDTDALRRREEARHRQNIPSLTPHRITSSSPPRDTSNDADKSGKARKDDTKDKKEKRKIARLDEGRLLGPDGFPALIKEVKRFKPKGKGQEAGDLERLLRIYGYWTHTMYPKTTFKDTVERVEKLCHSKRMHVALSVWRDEWNGKVAEQKSDEENSLDDLFGEEATVSNQTKKNPVHSSDAASEPPSSDPPSQAQSDAGGSDLDDFDIEDIIRAEEQRAAEETTKSRRARNLVVDSDDERLEQGRPTHNLPGIGQADLNASSGIDDDMWDILDEMDGVPPPGTTLNGKNAPVEAEPAAAMEIDEYDIEDMYA